MTATIDKATLSDALAQLTATVGDPRRFAIVGSVVLGGATASTTDMESFTTVTLPLEALPPTAVDCRKLHEIVRSLPPGPVTLEARDGRVAVTSGRSRFVLPTLDSADFPTLPVVPVLAAVAADSAAVLKLAARLDTDRYGVRFDWFDGLLNVAATDGYRLVVAGETGDGAVSVSGRALKCIDGVAVTHMGSTQDWAFFASDGVTVGVRRIASDYPDVAAVVKSATANVTGTAHVDGAALRAALGRVTLLAGESARVELALANGRLTLTGRDVTAGEATDSVAYEGDVKSLTTAVNGRYLADWARFVGQRASIAVNGGGGSPLLLTTDGQLEGASYVLMPMR